MASPFRKQFTPFKSTRAGVRVNLPDPERDVLVQLLGQLDDLLDDGSEPADSDRDDPLAAIVGIWGADLAPPDPRDSGDPGDSGGPDELTHVGSASHRPEDPAIARLLPDGNRDDPEMSAEFRRLTEYGLRARKRTGAQLAAQALSRRSPVVLDPPEALALLKALTDVRLVLGERLELRTDQDAERLHEALWAGEGGDAFLATASVYELLTSWQEFLVIAVSGRR